jgi:hypothetical protein
LWVVRSDGGIWRAGGDGPWLIGEVVPGVVYDWDLAADVVVRSSGLADLIGVSSQDLPQSGTWWRALVHGGTWSGSTTGSGTVTAATAG